jgi:phage repressor protein C with HTH and peptisase S24 domain
VNTERWPEEARNRLKMLINRSGRAQAAIAQAAGMSPSNLSNLLSSGSEPGAGKLQRLAEVLEVSVDYIMTGAQAVGEDTVLIPLAQEVEASAGDGAATLDMDGEEMVPFPRVWLQRAGASPRDAALMRVRGDSMSPKILHGDMVLFDRSRRDIADGIYLIRLDNTLCVKQISVFDQGIRVCSELQGLYPDRVVSFDEAQDPSVFSILGRVIWAGRQFH